MSPRVRIRACVSPERVAGFSLAEQLQCVTREITWRRQAYPMRIGAGLMTHQAADREIGLMQAVEQTLRRILTFNGAGSPAGGTTDVPDDA